MRDNRDQDYLEDFTYDADTGGEYFMGGQEAPASIDLPAEVAPAMDAGPFSGIAGLPPEIAAAIAKLIAAQAAGAPAEVAPGMVAGEAAGIPELLAQSDTVGSAATGALPAEVAPVISGQETGFDKLVEQSIPDEGPTKQPYTFDELNQMRGQVKNAPSVPAEVAPAMAPASVGGLPAEVAPAIAAGQGAGIAELLAQSAAPAKAAPAAPVAAYQAPTAREMRDGVGKDGQVAALSQTQGYGMVPVYQAQQGRGADRGEPVLMGYEFNPIAAGLTTVDTPKPAAILAEEKRLGKEMEPTYATYTAPRGQGGESVAYGPPTGYRYDNGESQYVKFDASGNYYETEKRKGGFDDALKMAALFAAIASGGAALGLGAGAGAAGTAAAAFTPEMIAAGLAPGSIGAAGAASGALTGANLAAASGIGSLGAGALTGAAGTAALPASEVASLSNALPSVNEMIASGMSPGSAGAAGAASGALTPAQLAAAAGASGTGITSLAPVAKSVNEMIASGMSPGSAGAAGAAEGLLTAEQLAAASGVVTEGATPALFEAGRAGKGLTSANEAVASGLGPGSAGAKAAVEGTLTAQELAAAAGTAGALNKDGITDLLGKAKDVITDKAKDKSSGSSSGMGLGGALGLMALMSMMNKGGGAAPASTATIPELTATRSQLPYDVDKKGVNPNTPYRPGQGGVTYFSPTTYTPTPPKAAGGGLMSLGQSNLGGYSDGGRLLKGPGDGVSDSIPAIIGRKQPARLANGEFVIPARIVSELGNGSTDAGAKRLYEMMARVQKARRNTKNVAANTKAAKYLPA